MKRIIHMHQIRDFISDRYSYYNKYFNNVTPRSYQFKGAQKAFKVGTTVDYAIKQYYLSKDKEPKYPKELYELPKTDAVICIGMVEGYIDKYKNYEHFENFSAPEWIIPFGKKWKIICSPDLVAEMFSTSHRVIFEIKTGAKGECLDFQTMCYCWASWRWDFVVPKYVLKRTIAKPRIKLKKNEKLEDFQKRILEDYNDDKHFKTEHREVNKNMCKEFEKYLTMILKEMASTNKYKFWKKPEEYWGI